MMQLISLITIQNAHGLAKKRQFGAMMIYKLWKTKTK